MDGAGVTVKEAWVKAQIVCRKHPQCYTNCKKLQCLIKIWGAGVVTPPPPSNNFCFYPLPILRCFWKDSLMTSHPHHPTSSIFHCYPLPFHHPWPPNKNFDHTSSAFRINEILTTLKQYFEGLRAVVNEMDNNYQELNPLQYGGGEHYGPLYAFLMLHQNDLQ